MPSPWGAALETLGSGLMKFGMMKMEQEQDLAKEARTEERELLREKRADERSLSLAKQKAEMEQEMKQRIAEATGKRIAEARKSATGLLGSQMAERTGLTELERLQGVATAGFAKHGVAPTDRPDLIGDGFSEADVMSFLTQPERDIYSKNLQEQIDFARSVKPSQRAIDTETWRTLRETDPEAAKAFIAGLKDEADITKTLAGTPTKYSYHFNDKTGEIIRTTETGGVEIIRKGAAGGGGGGGKPLTAKEKAENKEIELARAQVGAWQAKNPSLTLEMMMEDPAMKATVTKARQAKHGGDRRLEDFIQGKAPVPGAAKPAAEPAGTDDQTPWGRRAAAAAKPAEATPAPAAAKASEAKPAPAAAKAEVKAEPKSELGAGIKSVTYGQPSPKGPPMPDKATAAKLHVLWRQLNSTKPGSKERKAIEAQIKALGGM